ncbi:MAG: hypothetical protein U1E19_10035 [Rhodoblastus sp.]
MPTISAGLGGDSTRLWVLAAERLVPADLKSGLHFCFVAPTRASVDAFRRGRRWPRAAGQWRCWDCARIADPTVHYAAFVVDPDGYRIEAYCSAEA